MKLAVGTAQFGLEYGIANRNGRVTHDEAAAIVRRAEAGGVDTLDTAMAYGDSETRLGEIGIERWHVVTKLPEVPADCVDVSRWVECEVRESLGRLRLSRLYGLLLHRPHQLLEAGGHELYRALLRVQDAGYVEKIGVSIYEPSELDRLPKPFAYGLVQAPLSVLDNRLIDSGWLSRLFDGGVEVHARSVFLQGLLLMDAPRRPAKFGRWASLLGAYDGWVAQSGLTPLQACLGHVYALPEVTRVVVGVDSVAQLEQLLSTGAGTGVPVPSLVRCDDVELLNPGRWAP